MIRPMLPSDAIMCMCAKIPKVAVIRTALLVILVVASTALAGCGGSRGYSHGPRHSHFSIVHTAVCGYTAYRTVHDLRNGHHFAGAFNAYLAVHHCRRIRR